MAAPVQTRFTVADLDDFPDDGARRELIDGVLYVDGQPSDDGARLMPPPLWRHQRVAMRIGRRLLDYTDTHGGEAVGGPGVKRDEENYVEPDIVLVAADAVPTGGQRFAETPPALVVEVSSPSTRTHDLVRKRAWYERGGVAELWFVDLDVDRVEVYRLRGDGRYAPPELVERGGPISPPHLPGLAVEVDDVLGPATDA